MCVAVLENAPDTPIVPGVDDYRSSVLAQLNVMEFAITSPVGVSPKPKSRRRSSGLSTVKHARTQADVKLRPQATETGSSEQGPTPKAVSHSSQTRANIRGRGVSVRGRSGRRTGGKTLVLSSCGSESSMLDVAGPSKKWGSAVAKQRSKRTIVDSSDDASEEY